ncbi:7907_t:CDS:1, partial [Ambispora gerdemannii]
DRHYGTQEFRFSLLSDFVSLPQRNLLRCFENVIGHKFHSEDSWRPEGK